MATDLKFEGGLRVFLYDLKKALFGVVWKLKGQLHGLGRLEQGHHG